VDHSCSLVAFLHEARRRGVFKVAALYIVGAWLVIQVADVFYPAWQVPEAALRLLLVAAVLGFPIAFVFGWMFDVSVSGIRRTPSAVSGEGMARPLRRSDYLTLAGLAVAAVLIGYGVTQRTLKMAREDGAPRALVEKPPNSIAVLPFVNVSDDPSNEYFSDGISEEILHRLSDYRDMHVLARQSSFAFKGANLDAPRLSDVLGVRYLLQGSVRRDGDQLRISAQLVDDTGFQVWSEIYDRKMSGVFAIQTDIAAAVADSLAKTIAASRVDPRAYDPDIDAYQHYLLGREYLRSRTPGYVTTAIEHFQQAVAIDPNYPEPYAGHAIALLLDRGDAARYVDRLEEAEALIDTALSLNPDLAIGLAAKGFLLQEQRPPDYRGAEAALRAAVAIDPNLPGARNWLGNALALQGLSTAALEEWNSALAHDPLDPILATNAAVRYAQAGDFGDAEKRLLRLLDLPNPPGIVFGELRSLYDEYGRFVEAIDIGKQAVLAHFPPDSAPWLHFSFLAVSYAHLGIWEQADYWQDRAEALAPTEPGTLMRRGLIYRLKGENRELAALIDAQGLDPARLPPWIGQVMGAIKVVTGQPQEGIELLEARLDMYESDPGDLSLDMMQSLAHAYMRTGDKQRAAEVIDHVADALELRQRQGVGRNPGSLLIVFQNHAVAGEVDSALAALQTLIESGWPDYYWVMNDLRWAGLRANTRFQALMARVKTDINAQRARVEQIDAKQDFAALLELRATADANADQERR